MDKMEWNGKSWICPSDRELTLRAKLGAGWSVHSNDVFRKGTVLPSTERQSIEDVLHRAKHLEILESERIQKMVCRLNNMTQNTLGDGRKTCAMCAASVGRFRASFIRCYDCTKAVCEKCSIDTHSNSSEIFMLCKICAEDREVWKKSGSWFYGQLPPSDLKQDPCSVSSSGSPNQNIAFETWEHRAPDIVRFESFEPPEERNIHEDNYYNESSFYRNWATNSNPNIKILEENEESSESSESVSDNGSKAESNQFLAIEGLNTKLSLSCPSLHSAESNKRSKLRSFGHRTKERFLSPARKVTSKIHKKNTTITI
ncbi:rabphilin-1-like [Uloborus diversus]|uniref:rabphilin-1-like n=1 Tax=Uloborus diversus TaxID=327109 RepID=UPI00240951AC|nr:rabphilin-1-like [Uloborus diversus]XP_054710474.1 rabphilin-1-like [Uloborus diversus]